VINQRVAINGKTLDGDTLPANMQHATSDNHDRCSINTGLFSELVKTKPDKAVTIFADDVEMHGADLKNTL
jgi:hypothetical protein